MKTIRLLQLIAATFLFAYSIPGIAANISVVSLTKISETRFNRTDYDYVFTVSAQNGAQALSNAKLTLASAGAGVTIIDGNIAIGNLAANAAVTPSDTITLRLNRTLAFNQAELSWIADGTIVNNDKNLAWMGNAPLPTGAALFDVDGYAALGTPATGGGVLAEDDASYRKVTTPAEFLAALTATKRTLAKPVKVIEIMNDLNLGTIESGLAIAGLYRAQSTQAQLHPILKQTGMSLIDIKTVDGLTIYSKNGATIRHSEWNIKDANNVIIRNLKFDEMWEWDEATKGDYDKNDWDYITLGDGTDATKVWIDHCTFYKAYDGIVDVKGASSGVTISWSKILGGDSSNGAFIRAQMDYLEANKASMTMYNKLRSGGLTQEQITEVASTVKKGHLIGATAKSSENNSLQVTLHHNYYKDLQDRMPRLRGGDVQVFNIYADSSNARNIKSWLDPIMLGNAGLAKDFTGSGAYHFGITSNGTIATEDGVIEVANSFYSGVLTPLRNNQTDVNDNSFTGSIIAVNTRHELMASDMPISSQQTTFTAYGKPWATWYGNSGDATSTLGPIQAPVKLLAFKTLPPTTKALHKAADLPALLVNGAGAGAADLTRVQWMKSIQAAANASSSVSSSSVASSVKSVSSSSSSLSSSLSSVATSSSSAVIVPSSSSVSVSSSSVPSSISSSSSSQASSINNAGKILFQEKFDVTKADLFSATYYAISTDSTAAMLYITGGSTGISITNGELTSVGGRFTIGNRPPRTATTASDITSNGDFDLSKPYRISFKVIASSGSGALQVLVDNNTTSAGNSMHGSASRVFNAVASSLTAGQTIVIEPTIGTATSFISLRTESSASVTIDNLVIEYLSSGNVSSATSSSVTSSSPGTSSPSSASSKSSSVSSSSFISSSSSSVSSAPVVSSSSPTQASSSSIANGSISNDCVKISTLATVNWRDTSLQTDQEIVECLSKTLGKAIGYGENARGGFDANGNSKLTIISKSNAKSVEEQILDAISGDNFNWIVFDKNDFAAASEISLYKLYCSNSAVLTTLGIPQDQCMNYQLWCDSKGITDSATCLDQYFNKLLNNSSLTIRNPVIGSNKTIDGRLTNAFFRFSGFAIGSDSNGTPVKTSTNVILTDLEFIGAGHTEDHYLDPDMIRSTGASHDIWIHHNTFDLTGDSAFDVKVGAYNITMSFNKLQNVKRASLHGSSDAHVIDTQIKTTMHHNAFVTTDEHYLTFGNTARRVPLIRHGTSHQFNNLFVNYRKDILSIRVGATVLQEDNMFVVNKSLQEKSSVSASLAELQSNLIKDITDGNFRGDGLYLWFGDHSCILDNTSKTPIVQSSGSVANLGLLYSTESQNVMNLWHFSAGQELQNYISATAGKKGALPFNSPLAPDRSYVLPTTSCQ